MQRYGFVPLNTALVLCLLAGTAVRAQSGKNPETLNPTRVVFEHDQRGVTGFVLYIQANGKDVTRVDLGPLKPDRDGRFNARLPALPPGTYSLAVAAYNTAGESPRAATSPERLTISGPSRSTASSPADNRAHPPPEAPKPSTDAGKQGTEAKAGTESEKKTGKGGFLGKLGRVIVGSDD